MDIWIWPLDTTKTAVKELEMEGGFRGVGLLQRLPIAVSLFLFSHLLFFLLLLSLLIISTKATNGF